MKKRVQRKNGIFVAAIAVVICGFVILSTVSLIYFRMQVQDLNRSDQEEYVQYTKHYALVIENSHEMLWQEVYAGAQERCTQSNIYLELMGDNLAVSYTKNELFEIAIASKVDGIIVEADESVEMKALINKAVDSGIPVVTVLSDNTASGRQCFVGIGNYNLGREYGRQVVKLATKNMKEVIVLLDSDADNNDQNIIYTGIKETLSNEGNHLDLNVKLKAIDNSRAFRAKEMIQEIFIKIEHLPDVIICLNEENTITAYQLAVEYNMVGKVNIIGAYASETILDAVSKKILFSTIAIDSQQVGVSCVDALNEYIETGYVNNYVTIDTNAVTANNVKEYLNNVSQDDQE